MRPSCFRKLSLAEVNTALRCIKSFPNGTFCGRYGLQAQHLLDTIYGEGMCSLSLLEFVASAPMTQLLNLDGGICLIAIGAIWRFLVSKVCMKGVSKDMVKYLNDFQFGVWVSGGVDESIISLFYYNI
jgi:hypothetical protein